MMRMQSMLTKMTWLMKRKRPSRTCAASRMDPELEASILSHIGSKPRSSSRMIRPREYEKMSHTLTSLMSERAES